ncbi:hypothetical protein GCM10011376_02870 [Nocardioides flavus (ex Wang et al. 2016)]|uniref:Uncharacterized protein n=1 Tax=Nocardioides flavus (ex Wang et al. 2016) TaxID=2058780 RepID=A0ABQ3HGU5_9ACTN|nr:hypothetical protein [Nocardioides flavus (ex Wang et al. 2016)]GHE15302.1 hypothetical protein GCM10011376_02870 [Nocardioides flavus (ex Wang et al. 2016)]
MTLPVEPRGDRTTAPRLVAALALLLVLGAALGFGASWVLGENPSGQGAAAPVAASSPSLPVDPVPDLLPDPDIPALAPAIPLERQTVGAGGFRMSVPVPEGWTFSENSLNEWQWRPPDQPDFGHVLRVEQVLSNRRSIAWTLDRRIDELREDESGFEVLAETGDSLYFSFITSNHLRHGFLRWLDLTGSDDAQVEIAVTGREVDVPGMRDLVSRVASGVELGESAQTP